MLDSWAVVIGFVIACLTLLSLLGAVFRGLWKVARALVKFADALPKLLELAEQQTVLTQLAADFKQHAEDDAAFQTFIVNKLENGKDT